MYLSRKYYWKTFYVSKNSFWERISALVFVKVDKSTIPRNLKATIESGIWQRLEEEKWSKTLSRRMKSGEKVERRISSSVELDGSISTVFLLCGVLIALSLLGFGAECFWIALIFFIRIMMLLKFKLFVLCAWWNHKCTRIGVRNCIK